MKNRRRIHQLLPYLALIMGASFSLFSGCTGPQALGPEVTIPEKSAVIFFIDGLDVACLDRLLASDRLPTIKQRFVRRGVRFHNASACLPSDTYPNSTSLITGQSPGRHGVVGNIWFDRSRPTHIDYNRALTYRDVNYHINAPTIYELIRPLRSASIQCAAARGATIDIHGGLIEGLQWVSGNFSAVDAFSSRGVKRLIQAANRQRVWPALQMYYFPAVDKYGHEYGPHSFEYASAVERVDGYIGDILSRFEKLPAAIEPLFILVSDHGQLHTAAEQQFDPARMLADHFGHRFAISRPLQGSQRARYRTLTDTEIIGVPFRRRLELHIRGSKNWSDPASSAQVDATARDILRTLGFVDGNDETWPSYLDMLVMRAGTINSMKRDSIAIRIITQAGEYLIDAPQSANAWPHRNQYPPDTINELRTLMGNPRAGDIQLFASPGYAMLIGQLGNHGGVSTVERQIPMIVSHDKLAARDVHDHVRIVDIMPTIMDWLGCRDRIPVGLDGRSLLPMIGGQGWTTLRRFENELRK